MEQELLTRLAGPLSDGGLFLESVIYARGKSPLLRVVIDLPDGPGGVTSDQLAEATRTVSEVLDADPDLVPGSYTLVVTTPGVSRPLRDERHFRRAIGRRVAVTTLDGAFTERLVDVRGGVAVFEGREIALGGIVDAVQEIEMGKGK